LASQLAAVLRDQLPAWSVNTLAQAVGVRALADAEYAAETRQRVAEYRTQLEGLLGALPGLHLFPSAVNYLLVEARPPAPDAEEIARHCLCEHRIAIRVCANYEGLGKRYFRVAVRTPDENERIAVALHGALGIAAKASVRMPKRRCPALMIQGTTSNAGKSVLAAAFCRILAQDGIRVAPFKAQNMSLNSFVTRAGGEMGRAQVVQAQACHLDPDVRMNPILLKPNSETGSQVIVLGKPIGNMVVGTYTDAKARLREVAFSAYDSLAAECDAIVLEGAGSPAEVNLKKHDLVNMQMARHAQAPVLLVGDIDRGGVYAAFIGTLETMEEWERQLVAGFLVNRFRGDASLLAAAHEYVRQFTGKPVLGVVRYLPKLNVPQEDSVEFKSGNGESAPTRPDAVEIVVIDLPHISNFTDFDPFRLEPDVRLRVVGRAEDLGTPDAVILPGSKNVPGDLDALMASGLGARIAALGRDSRTCVVGICGGLQMLGRTIADPHGLEAGTPGERAGLGLLDLTTILERAKTLTRTEARHLRSGESVNGYEIHHGVTDPGSAQPVFRTADGREAGVGTADGRVWGTYLHGVFDADGFRRAFLDDLRVRNGLAPLGTICASYEIETALDQLADVVRHAVKMKHIYQLMGL
jgi:cobyric acid synthase CobQ